MACNNDDDNSDNCNKVVITSSELYTNAPADQMTINSLDLNENCLNISFSSSGCDGSTWEVIN